MNAESPLRVLWLTPDKPENISVGRSRLAEHLRERGYTVTVDRTTPRTFIKRLSERGRYDVVLGTTRAGAIAGIILSRVHGIPLLVDHVDPIAQFRETTSRPVAAIVERLERLAFHLARRVLYVYPEEQKRVEAYADATRTNLGVDFERFASPDSGRIESVRERLDSIDGSIAVYVGGLEPIYNIRTMLDSLDYLRDWTLVMAGDGTLRETVERAANGDNGIVYLGTIPHETIPGLLALADVGISLVDDPHTLKVMEYGAAGLPTVQLAGQAEATLGDAVTYCDLDPSSVADAIEAAAVADATALRDIAKRHSWKQIAEQYQDAIDEVVSTESGHCGYVDSQR